MDFKNFVRISQAIISPFNKPEANFPIMIRGRHGVGKSELVYQVAKSLNMKVVERRISQMMEGDLMGLPTTDGNKTSWNHPDWYRECCDEPRVLFFDEVDRGDQQVRQGIMEIGDSRKFNGLALHPNTIIIAAVNGGKYASDYQVSEMDPAEMDRWVVYDVEPTVDDWLEWAKNNVNNVIYSFILNNKDHLEHKDVFDPSEVYPSRRSWARLDKVLSRASLFEDMKQNLSLILDIASGFVGFPAAVALQEYISKYEEHMTAEDIVVHGQWRKAQTWGVNEHLAMSRKIGDSSLLTTKLPQDQLTNLANYFMLLPSECAASFWILFCGKAEENYQNPNMVDFNRTYADNGIMVAQHYASILTGNKW